VVVERRGMRLGDVVAEATRGAGPRRARRPRTRRGSAAPTAAPRGRRRGAVPAARRPRRGTGAPAAAPCTGRPGAARRRTSRSAAESRTRVRDGVLDHEAVPAVGALRPERHRAARGLQADEPALARRDADRAAAVARVRRRAPCPTPPPRRAAARAARRRPGFHGLRVGPNATAPSSGGAELGTCRPADDDEARGAELRTRPVSSRSIQRRSRRKRMPA
jgi:hypothetical protein